MDKLGLNTVEKKNEEGIYKRVEAEGKRVKGRKREGHWDIGGEGVLHY